MMQILFILLSPPKFISLIPLSYSLRGTECIPTAVVGSTMNSSDSRKLSSSTGTSNNSNDVPLKDMGLNKDVEANSLRSSRTSSTQTPNNAQAGVKNIEAVSMTWTKWGLIAAYARFLRSTISSLHYVDGILVFCWWHLRPHSRDKSCNLFKSSLRALSISILWSLRYTLCKEL